VRSAFGCDVPAAAPTEERTPPRLVAKLLRVAADGPHLEVAAEAATPAQLGVGLGQALGRPFFVLSGFADDLRFTFYLPDVTIAALNDALVGWGVRVEARGDAYALEPPAGGSTAAPDIAPMEDRLVTPAGDETAEQLAALFCRAAGGRGAWAQVVGDSVILAGQRDHLDMFEQLRKRIHGPGH
jgi:hypothetical protein